MSVDVNRYVVVRRKHDNTTSATILRDGRLIVSLTLDYATLCLPGGPVRGLEATDAQIIEAVIGDEDIFTGAPAFPELN